VVHSESHSAWYQVSAGQHALKCPCLRPLTMHLAVQAISFRRYQFTPPGIASSARGEEYCWRGYRGGPK